MREISQTTFGKPNGNCLAACVASILEAESIEDVPHYIDGDWFARWNLWLARRGLFWVTCGVSDEWKPSGLSILAGQSPRGDFAHVVVALDGELAFDPHPDRTGLLSREYYLVFAALDPARLVRR